MIAYIIKTKDAYLKVSTKGLCVYVPIYAHWNY